MNASETLGAGLIGKLAVITRQAERIHLVQPERHRSPWPRLRGEGGGLSQGHCHSLEKTSSCIYNIEGRRNQPLHVENARDGEVSSTKSTS